MQIQRKMARKYLRVGAVAERYDVSSSSIWRWANEARFAFLDFPRPVAIGLQARAWVVDELDAYDARRGALRDDEPASAEAEVEPATAART